jgi:inorganic pyrophosphatase
MSQASSAVQAPNFQTSAKGAPDTTDFRMFFNKPVSPWHDIPLQAGPNLFHYVNEIPKGTRAKMEICTTEASTPIRQDVKKGKLRFFGYGDIPFNYGAFPQTWEDPSTPHPLTGAVGDNDPIDVVEIGTPIGVGEVAIVKVLGCLALIDEGETDWKVIAVRKGHPLFDQLNDIQELQQLLPKCVDEIRSWFHMYKTADGKPPNTFAFDGKAMNRDFTLKVVQEANQSWKELRAGKLANPKSLSLV